MQDVYFSGEVKIFGPDYIEKMDTDVAKQEVRKFII
jgi:hypothetical protein